MRSIKALLLVLILSALTTQSLFAGKVERLWYLGSGTRVIDMTSITNGAGNWPSNFFAPYYFRDNVKQGFDPFPARILTDSLDQFTIPPLGNGPNNAPGNFADNYGNYTRGYLEAPQTGNYTFWIASDDDSELWLSTSFDPANKKKIAFNSGAVGYQNWGVKSTQRSALIPLVKGNKYYFEMLLKEGTGNDFVSVGWQLPDGSLNRPISGIYLAPFVQFWLGGVSNGDEQQPGRQLSSYTVPLFTSTNLYNGNPLGTNIVEGQNLVLFTTVDGAQPITYQWYKGSVSPANAIAGEILSSLTITDIRSANQGTYLVAVTNSFGGKVSTPANVVVNTDTNKPTIVSANAFGRLNGVTVVFSEAMSLNALTTNFYRITNVVAQTGFKVLAAKFPFANDFKTVDLVTEAFTVQPDNYTLVVGGVQDRAAVPNTIVTNSTIDFASVFGDGLITRRYFDNVGGGAVSDLTNNTVFINNQPTISANVALIEADNGRAENFGTQYIGYIIPKTNGNYVFAISSDDNSHLFLSSDESPANKKVIAAEPGWANGRQWTVTSAGQDQRISPANGTYAAYSNAWGNQGPANTLANTTNRNTMNTGPGTQINWSKPQALLANKRYYIEYLQKEGGGGDNSAVTWVVPTPTNGGAVSLPLADNQIPIQGDYLSTTGAVGGISVSINAQPQNVTTNDAKAATFTVGGVGASPLLFQWYRGNASSSQLMADQNAATLTTPPVTTADNGSQYFVVLKNGFSSVTSSIVTLTVIPDVTPPTLVGAKGSAFFNQFIVNFSETMDETSATNSANYQITPALALSTNLSPVLGPQRTNVIFFTADQPQATLYTINVSNVKDGSSNSNNIVPASVQFTSFVPSRGFVMREFYGNIGNGTAVINLQNAGVFPNSPDTTTYQTTLSSPSGVADNYGVRLSGTLTPPYSAGWVFAVASDDASSLYISANSTRSGLITNVPVALEGACCRAFSATIDRSTQIPLAGGTPIYFEGLLKEGGGGDFLNITWVDSQGDPQFNNDAYINNLQLISPTFLTAYADPAGATVAISRQPPTSVSVTELTALNGVDVVATGAITGNLNPPISYIWQRRRSGEPGFTDLANDVALVGQVGFNATNLVQRTGVPLVMTAADNQAQFRCIISVPGATVISGTTTVTVVPDNSLPVVIGVVADATLRQVTLTFNKPISAVNNVFNPTFSNNGVGNVIGYRTAFIPASAPNKITIFTDLNNVLQSDYTRYTITLGTGMVVDTTGNANALQATNINFQSWVVTAGLIERRQYNNIGGGAVSDLTNNAAFVNNQPTTTYFTNIFEGGNGIADNYGSYFRGYILPPEDGTYFFFVASDDQSMLFLSTDDKPANTKLIAVEPNWNNGRQWGPGNGQDATRRVFTYYGDYGIGFDTTTNQAYGVNRSYAITLFAGQKYYVEYFQKEGGGGDNGAVAWRTPSMTNDPVNGSSPITGQFLGSYINPDLSKITINTQPTNITTVERRKVTFILGAVGSSAVSQNAPLVYQWQKETFNGSGVYTNIPGANSANLIYDAFLSDSGLRFRSYILLTNPLPIVVSNFTSLATLTVTADPTAPTLVKAAGDSTLTKVTLTFSERVTKGISPAFSATFAGAGGVTMVSSVVNPSDDTQIIVTTTAQTPNTIYTVTVNGVTDIAATPNQMAANALGVFTSWVKVSGGIVRKEYQNITGGNVSDLTNNAAFINDTPNVIFATNEFNHPGTSIDNYGTRWQGYLTAPETGPYKFFVASDDQSLLYLSTDENPANRVLIAAEPSWNDNKSWNTGANQGSRTNTSFPGLVSPVNQSGLISLVAGQSYYVEYLHKEGGGGDNSGVAWKLPSAGSNPVNGSDAIKSPFLAGAIINPDASKITINSQPTSVTAPERRLVTFTVGASGVNAFSPTVPSTIVYQWQRNDGLGGFTNVPGANATSFTIDAQTTDDGAQFRAFLSMTNLAPIVATNISSVVTLTVIPDVAAPALIGLTRNAYQTNLVLTFSERITTASASTLANYSITNGGISIPILSVIQNANGSNIVLLTGLQTDSTNFTLTISNLVDLAGTPHTLTTTGAVYNTFANAKGYLRYERFNNINGTDVPALVSDPRYIANTPDVVDHVTSGWMRQTAAGVLGASGNIESFGARMVGYYIAPSNGTYRFFSRGDDGTRINLSTDINPVNSSIVAEYSPACCAEYNVSTNNNGQARAVTPSYPTVTLVAGQRYYMEAILKEGGGGDWMEIQTTNSLAPAPKDNSNNGQNVIPASQISTLVDPDLASLSITAQPVGVNRTNGNSVTFTVTATGTSPLPGSSVRYQWQKGGVDIVGATNSSYTIASVVTGDAGSYRALVYLPEKATYSQAAVLTVAGGPSIVTALTPTSIITNVGANVSLTVAASGDATLYYQLQKNSVNVGAAQTTGTFPLNNIQYVDQGTYRVVITNGVSAITNGNTILQVLVTPYSFANATKVGSNFGVSFNTDAGRSYSVKYKDKLTDPTWLPLTTVVGTGSPAVITDPGATGGERYYRIETLFP